MLEPNSDLLHAQHADGRLEAAPPKPEFGIGSFVRHGRLIGACGLAFLLVGGIAAVLKPTRFTASTQLLVYNRELQPGVDAVILKGRADVSVVQNEIELVQSRSVLTKVAEAMSLDKAAAQPSLLGEFLQAVGGWFGGPADGSASASQAAMSQAIEELKGRLAVRRVGTSHVISIAATEADPVAAAQTANEVARAYLQTRAATSSPEATRDMALRERLQGLGPNAYVISAAETPLRPDGPRKLVILVIGLAFGLGVGSALALALDVTDRTLRTPEQAEFVLGLECVGAVPDLAGGGARQAAPWRENVRQSLAELRRRGWQGTPERYRRPAVASDETLMRALREPDGRVTRTLRRTAALIATELPGGRIGVTSALPGEGATTIAASLAGLLAEGGRKVLLLDATGRLASSASPSGRTARGERVRPAFAGLDHGSSDSDAAWMAALEARVRDAGGTFDIVIVDLPALADGPKVPLAANAVDAFLLVLKWGETDSELVQQALHSSGKARSKFVGAILNFVDERLIGTYGDKLAAAQMALLAPDAGADRPISDVPAAMPAGNATTANA